MLCPLDWTPQLFSKLLLYQQGPLKNWKHKIIIESGQNSVKRQSGHTSKPEPEYRTTWCPPTAPSRGQQRLIVTLQRASDLPWVLGRSRNIPTRTHTGSVLRPQRSDKNTLSYPHTTFSTPGECSVFGDPNPLGPSNVS